MEEHRHVQSQDECAFRGERDLRSSYEDTSTPVGGADNEHPSVADVGANALTTNPAYGIDLAIPYGEAGLTAANPERGRCTRNPKSLMPTETMYRDLICRHGQDLNMNALAQATNRLPKQKQRSSQLRRAALFFCLSLVAVSLAGITLKLTISRRQVNVVTRACPCSYRQGVSGDSAEESTIVTDLETKFNITTDPETKFNITNQKVETKPSRLFPAAHVVSYLERSPDGKSDLFFSSTISSDHFGTPPHAFLRGVSLVPEDGTRTRIGKAGLRVQVAGVYFVYGQVSMEDCRHRVYYLHLLLNGHRMASSYRSSGVVKNQTCFIESETLSLGRLMQLRSGDVVRIAPEGSGSILGSGGVELEVRGHFFGLFKVV